MTNLHIYDFRIYASFSASFLWYFGAVPPCGSNELLVLRAYDMLASIWLIRTYSILIANYL